MIKPLKADALARNARRLRAIVVAAIATIFLLYLGARIGVDVGEMKVMLGERPSVSASMPWITDVEMVFLLLAMLRLTQTLGLLASGDTFSVALVRRFRGFAFWLMLSAIIGFVGLLLAGLLSDVGNGEIRLALAPRQLLVLGITSLLFLFARLLERARELEKETREFI